VGIGFISDTVVVGFIMKDAVTPHFAVMMAARWAAEASRLGIELAPSWSYRGVVTYGEFAINEAGNFFVGPAVSEAAAWYERAKAAVILLAPSAKEALRDATDGDFAQGAVTTNEHDIPLKESRNDTITTYRTYVASPFDWPAPLEEAEGWAAALLATFDDEKPGVAEKRRNTEAFLSRHMEEYRALYAKTTVPLA